LRAAGETETMQENIQDWLQLDEGDPGFQFVFLWILNNGSTVIFFIYFLSALPVLLNFILICFVNFLLRLSFDSLIRIIA
jgi:hypothetical protein